MGEAVAMAVDGAEAFREAIQDILALDVEAVIKTTEEGAGEEDTTDMGTTRPLLTGEGAGLATTRPLPQDSSPAHRPLMAMEAIRDSVAGATEAMGPPGMEGAGETLTMVTSSIRGLAGEGRRGRRGHAALSLASINTSLIRGKRQWPEARRRKRQRSCRRLCLRRRAYLRSIWSRTLGRIRVN